MDSPFEKEARELLTRNNFTPFGWATLERAIAEAMRSAAERGWDDGVLAEQELQANIARRVFPPGATPQRRLNPYTKPNQGER